MKIANRELSGIGIAAVVFALLPVKDVLTRLVGEFLFQSPTNRLMGAGISVLFAEPAAFLLGLVALYKGDKLLGSIAVFIFGFVLAILAYGIVSDGIH